MLSLYKTIYFKRKRNLNLKIVEIIDISIKLIIKMLFYLDINFLNIKLLKNNIFQIWLETILNNIHCKYFQIKQFIIIKFHKLCNFNKNLISRKTYHIITLQK